MKRREKIINIPRNIVEIRSKSHVHLLPCIEIGRLARGKLRSGVSEPRVELLLLFRDNKKNPISLTLLTIQNGCCN